MAIPFEATSSSQDPRALRILAKSIYKELRSNGLSTSDVMGLAGELLALVTTDVKSKNGDDSR
jgi:hypothetical protein